MAISDEVRADLKILLDATSDRRLTGRWNYYSGAHPKIYATPKLRDTFKGLADSFDENYCGLAINARLSRLEVIGWDGPDAEQAQQVWDDSRLARRQSRLWRYALVHSRACLIADVGDGPPRLLVNPGTIAYGHPRADEPDALAWLGKVWPETATRWRATLMYPDETVRLVADTRKPNTRDLIGWDVDPDDPGGPNPLVDSGAPPGVQFSPYDEGQPLIDGITGLQNRINKLAANKFVAAEFSAFRQRVFFTRQEVTPFELRNAPDHAIVLDPGDTDAKASVTEFTASDLANYDRAKDAEVDALFTIATLPRHMRVNPGTPPSGEAIKADEGPFVEAIRDLQNQLGETLVEGMALLGIEAEPLWRDPTVHNELAQAQTVQTLNDAGMPVGPLMVRYAGWDEQDVTDALAQGSATAVATAGSAVGAALLGAFNAPGVPTGE